MAEPNSNKPNSANDKGVNSESRNPSGSGLNSNLDATGPNTPYQAPLPPDEEQDENKPGLGRQVRRGASNYRTLKSLSRPGTSTPKPGGADSALGSSVGEGAEAAAGEAAKAGSAAATAGGAAAGAVESAGAAASQASMLGGPEVGAIAGLGIQLATNPKMRKAARRGDIAGVMSASPTRPGFEGLRKSPVGAFVDPKPGIREEKNPNVEQGAQGDQDKKQGEQGVEGPEGAAGEEGSAAGRAGGDKHGSYGKSFLGDAAHRAGFGAEGKFDKSANRALKGAGAPKGGLKDIKDNLGKIALESAVKHKAQELSKKLHLTNVAATLTFVFWALIGWSLFFQGFGILFVPGALLAINFPLISTKYAYKTALLIVSLFAGPEVYKYGQYVGPNDVKLKTWHKLAIIFSDMAMVTLFFVTIFIIVAGVCYVSLKGPQGYLAYGASKISSTVGSAYAFCQSIVGGTNSSTSGSGDFGGAGAGGSFGGSVTATGKKFVLVGDSLMPKFIGPLYNYVTTAGGSLVAYSIGGTMVSDWVNGGKTKPSNLYNNHPAQKQGPGSPTTKMSDIVAKENPDVIIIVLNTNPDSNYKNSIPALVAQTGGKVTYWVGTPKYDPCVGIMNNYDNYIRGANDTAAAAVGSNFYDTYNKLPNINPGCDVHNEDSKTWSNAFWQAYFK